MKLSIFFLAIITTLSSCSSGGCKSCTSQNEVSVSLDEQEVRLLSQMSPTTLSHIEKGLPLTAHDVIELSKAAIHDQFLLQYMKETRSTYKLDQQMLRALYDAGVSKRIVQYMIDSGR